MHAILIAIGSAGDVFPFIGLARTLKLRGHRVSLCTIPVFRDAVEQHGIAFVPLSDELTYRRTMGDPRLWDPKTSFGVLWQAIAGMIEPVYEYVSAQRHDDIVVVGSLWALGARIAHEKYGIPYLSAQVSPSTLLSAHLPPVHPKFNVPEQMPLAMRKLLWRCIERFKLDRTCAPEINAVRRKVGLETPVKRIFTQWMHSPQGVVCLALLASASLQAQESRLDRILESGVLRVATTGDYKPFSYRTEEGGYAGFDVDMAQRLAESLGAKLVVVPTSWPNLMRDFADDRFDIAMSGISINLERQRQAYFSIPYLRDGKTPITLCSEEARFQTLEQIDQPGVTAIVNPGGTNEKFARANLKKARILVHPDNVTIFQQIVDGKADLMMTDAIEARLQSRLHPELCAVHPQQPFDFAEKAYLLPRDEAFKRYVDQWLHIAEQSGLLRQRMEHWLEYRWPTAHGK